MFAQVRHELLEVAWCPRIVVVAVGGEFSPPALKPTERLAPTCRSRPESSTRHHAPPAKFGRWVATVIHHDNLDVGESCAITEAIA